MAHLIEPLEMRDQLYDFLSNHAMLTEIATWSKSLLDVVPDEADSAGKAFPVAAVTWHYEWNAMETSPITGVLTAPVASWVCISCKANIADGSDVTSTDQAVRLANLELVLARTMEGAFLSATLPRRAWRRQSAHPVAAGHRPEEMVPLVNPRDHQHPGQISRGR